MRSVANAPRTTPDGFRRPLFSREVFASRRRNTQQAMQDAGIDLLAITSPENIYYLTGLDHFGYFALHLLLVPADDEAVLVARRMEHVTVSRDVPDLHCASYGDEDDLAAHCVRVARSMAPEGSVLGLEARSIYLPPNIAQALREQIPRRWLDSSDLVTDLRLAQSPEEIEVTRGAARISDNMVAAAIGAAGVGVSEQQVAEAMISTMVASGGEPPAYWPFIRSTPRLNEDHTTWTDYRLRSGDALFLELSGSIGRYHAPIGRVVFVEVVPAGSSAIADVCLHAYEAARAAARPGVIAGDVYAAWQSVVDEAGLFDFRRHHCGYATGIGFPPSWSGNGVPLALRPRSSLVLRQGMVFHLMSWMMGTGRGDYFVSDPVLIKEGGAERLCGTPQEPRVV